MWEKEKITKNNHVNVNNATKEKTIENGKYNKIYIKQRHTHIKQPK